MRAPTILSDEAVYVVLARALRGFQYRELFQVDLPVHRLYPPGYPLLLAAWSAIGPERLDWLVLVGIASSAGALFLLFSAIRNRWGSGVALACLSGVALNFTLISSAGWLLSEAPFMFFSTLALWALSHEDDRPRDAVTAGAAAIAAALIRSAGVSFVVGLALYWLWQRRYRRVLTFGLLAGLTVGGWLVFSALAPMQVPGNSYIADAALHPASTSLFRAVVDRALGKLPYARYLYWQLAPTVEGSVLDDVIVVPVLLGGLGVGLFALAIEWPATIVSIVSYGALLMVWPWTLDRFLFPLLPWLVSAVIIGIDRLIAIVRPRWRTAGMCLAVGVLALKGLSDTSYTIERQRSCDRAAALPSRACLGQDYETWADFFDAVGYVRGQVASDAIFLSVHPATLFYFTAHRVVSLPLALIQPPDEFLDFLRGHGVTYVMLSALGSFNAGTVPGPGGGTPLGEMVQANCQGLRLEASFHEGTYLFHITAPNDPPDSRAACEAAERFVARNRTERK